MKILKVEFRNINSLRGDHKIDFTVSPFTGSSLFAITGPTGSGKSTILDVISLALFNKIPRLEKISTSEIVKTGAIITRNQQDAMAAVTYESKDGRFRSEWSISTARTGSLREYKMQLSQVETNELFDLKKSEVPGKNEELIGLNYNQFIKSVLLAQGEFAQFLKAKKDERGELLEKITGTGIYRQLGKRSYEKFKEVNKEIEVQQNRIAAIKEQLLEEEQQKEFSEKLKQKDCEVKDFEKKIASLNKQLELKRKINQQLQEIKTQQNQKQEAETKLKEFEESHGLPLKQHEKIEAEAEDLRNWSQLKKEIWKLKEELDIHLKKQQQNMANLEKCLSEAANLIDNEISSEDISEKLESFSRKVTALQQERRDKGQDYSVKRSQLKRELQGIQFQLNEENLQENAAQLKHLLQDSEEKIADFRSKLVGLDLENAENEKERLAKQLELAREAWRKDGEIRNISTEIGRYKSEENALSAKLKDFPPAIEIAKSKTDLYRERLEKQELKRQNEILQANLEEHRHQLRDGEPCPLCGALEHPYASILPEKDDSLTAEIQKARKELDNWKSKLTEQKTNFSRFRERTETSMQQRQTLEEKLAKEKENFTANYGHLCQDIENPDWEHMCHNWNEQVQKIQRLQEEQRHKTAISTGIPLLEELQEIFSEGNKLKKQLEKLYVGEDIISDTNRISTHWTSLEQEGKNIKERISELERKSAEKKESIVQLEEKLFPAVQSAGFENIEKSREALMGEAECKSLRAEREEIQKKITAADTSLSLLHSQLETSKKADVAEEAEDLDKTLEEDKQKLEATSAECRELYSHLKTHTDNLERLKAIQEQIAEKEKEISRWRLLNELIGDATGKKFNDFAQDLSLSQLLQLANLRLKDLSDRYLIDKSQKEENDGLVAIDEHMGGQRRSVKTLSGGETFILSLSMALALSDLTSKNVEINSLFIDEGFGTLDHETLDQTLDTLEKLQAESSKTIGIISHVDSLKERISTQIRLKRNGQGYSQLEVVPKN